MADDKIQLNKYRKLDFSMIYFREKKIILINI